MAPENNPDLALELAIARLQGTVDTQFAEVKGQLRLLVTADERMTADVAALEVRVTALEKRVWMASGVATLVGMGVPFLVQLLNGG